MKDCTLIPIVAIDGPVGVGKSTVAKRVADKLHFPHLDTGAMYRAVALRVMEQPAELRDDEETMTRIARELAIEFRPDGVVLLDGEDITLTIRDEAVSRFVSRVADAMGVRAALVDQQRRLGSERPSVLEGRDIGTVVFPMAALKVYLDASPEVRVERRCAQLLRLGQTIDREAIYAALLERDARDRAREWGALRLAKDARLIDTTYFNEDMVVDLICAMVAERPEFHEVLAGER